MAKVELRDLETVDDPDAAAALLHPLKARILRLAREPASATELARRLDLPRQRVHYHVRELERAGLLRRAGRRRRRNLVEQRFVASARSYVLSPALLGPLAADWRAVEDASSPEYLLALTEQVRDDVARAASAAEATGRRASTFSLKAQFRLDSEAQRAAFATALREARRRRGRPPFLARPGRGREVARRGRRGRRRKNGPRPAVPPGARVLSPGRRRGAAEGGEVMIGQIVSLLGAGMILAAFGAQQAGKWTPDARPYLVLNFLGSAILTWFAGGGEERRSDRAGGLVGGDQPGVAGEGVAEGDLVERSTARRPFFVIPRSAATREPFRSDDRESSRTRRLKGSLAALGMTGCGSGMKRDPGRVRAEAPGCPTSPPSPCTLSPRRRGERGSGTVER